MNYNIPLNKLEKLVNPFNDNTLEYKISENDIKLTINYGNIFPHDDDKNKDKLIKQIAYKVMNYEPEEILVNLSAENIGNSNGTIIERGLVDLAAAIYRKEKNIVGIIQGDAEVVQKLLNVDINKPDNIELNKFTSQEFNWEAINGLIDNWSDPDFVANRIKSTYNSFKQGECYREVQHLIQDELWENVQFYKNLSKFHDTFINYMPKEALFSFALTDYVIERPNKLFALWKSGYEKVWTALYEQEEQKKIAQVYRNPTFEELVPEEYREAVKYNMEKIQTHIFDNKEKALILVNDQVRCGDFYHCFSNDIKYDFDILEILHKFEKESENFYKPNVNVIENLPLEYSNNFDWIKEFLTKYSALLSWNSLPQYYEKNSFDKLLSSWFDDKSKVIDIISSVHNNSDISYLYKVLPKDIKNDAEVIDKFLGKYPQIFEELTQSQKLAVLPTCLDNYHFVTSNINIENNLIYQIDDKNTLLKIIKMNKTDWFFNKQSEKWHADKDFLIEIAKKTHYVTTYSGTRKYISTLSKEQHIEIVDANKDYYQELPFELRNDPEIALIYLRKSKEVNRVVSQLYLSKDFCLKSLTLSDEVINKIPEQFWRQKDFALEYCKGLDSGMINKKTIISAPKYVSHLFDSANVTENYTGFMNSYLLNLKLKESLPEKTNKKNKKKI